MAERPPAPPNPAENPHAKGHYAPGVPFNYYEELVDIVQARLARGAHVNSNDVAQGPPAWHSFMVAGEETLTTWYPTREQSQAAKEKGKYWFEDAKEAIGDEAMEPSTLQAAYDSIKAHNHARGGKNCKICKDHPDHFSHW
jgi:hypothetical protein